MKLKRIIQMLSDGISMNAICRETSSSKKTVSEYKKAALATQKSYTELLSMEESELAGLLLPPTPAPPTDSRKEELDGMMQEVLRRLSLRYANVQLVYEEYYLKRASSAYSYTQFKKHVKDYKEAHSYSYHNVYHPGEEWQIDFAGDPLYLTDRKTGVVTKVVVLVCVMPYSELPFLMALPNATTEWFFHGLNKGLEFLGALPRVAKSDNMKQWVTKSDRYSPTLSDGCIEWANHYHIGITACRVRKPRDKGPVESAVKQLYTYIYARIQEEVFGDIDQLNLRLWELLDEYIRLPYKGSSRLEIFEQEEKPVMEPLSQEMHRFRYRKEVKLSSTYHVCVGHERHFYSVPYQYVSQQVSVLWDTELIEVFAGNERICIHQRSFARYGYSTNPDHMPPSHKAYERSKEQNASTLLYRASFIGASVQWTVQTLLAKKEFPQQAYGQCNALLALVSTYGKERVENACRMMKTETSTASLRVLTNILKNNRDLAMQQGEPAYQTPQNDNVRGAFNYSSVTKGKEAES